MNSSAFRYQPALDGLRAVSVLLVLLFHTGVSWLPGGYLGVSVFFTLSGYLITSLLLVEHRSTGTISLGGFYARRVRRLLPASLLGLALVLVARSFGAFSEVPGLRADVIGAIFQVINWVQLAGSTSYSDLFGSTTSPLEHYWSLAIEEQFYWVWPVVMLVLLRRWGRSWISVAVVTMTAVLSVGAVVIAQVFGPDAAYWATPARLPEILIGASLACVTRWPRHADSPADRRGRARGGPVPAWVGLWAPVALVAVLAAAVTFPSGSGPAYEGLLPVFALVTALLIAGLQVPGQAACILSWRPLVSIGKVSYGLYVFHWPVFVLLRERGWDLTTPGGMLVAAAITTLLTVVSYRLVERPVRSSSWTPLPTYRLAAAVSAVVLVAGIVMAPPTRGIEADDELLAAVSIVPSDGSLAPLGPLGPQGLVDSVPSSDGSGPVASTVPSPESPTVSSTVSPTVSSPESPTVSSTVSPTVSTTVPLVVPLGPSPLRPVRVITAGDSTLLYVAEGLATWAVQHPDQAQISVQWCQGCTFLLDPEIVTFPIEGMLDNSRRVIGEELPSAVGRLQPDVVMLMATVNEVADRQWSVAEGPLGPRDPRFRERMRLAYLDLTMRMIAAGAPKVVWVVPPTPVNTWNEPAMNEPGRFDVHHDVLREVVGTFAADVHLVDLDAWLTAAGHADDPAWREDGVHLTEAGAAILAEQFLGPWLVGVALSR